MTTMFINIHKLNAEGANLDEKMNVLKIRVLVKKLMTYIHKEIMQIVGHDSDEESIIITICWLKKLLKDITKVERAKLDL